MKNRDSSIDFLRATAIVLMTITHVNALLYIGKNPLLDIFTSAGATLCFSIFLFCSAYIIGLKIQSSDSLNIKNIIKRIVEIYFAYLVLGILITFVFENSISFSKIVDIALLKYVPEFVEFLISFILFSLLPLFFYKKIKYLMSKPLLFIIVSIFVYIIGLVVYNLISNHSYPDIIRIPLENIFGYKSLHRFPLTFYFPIYVFGILLSKYNSKKILISIIVISSVLMISLLKLDLSHWHRWPPSIFFLLYGYVFIPFLLLICKMLQEYISKGIFKIFSNMGRFPLEQLFLSTFLIFISRYIFLPSSDELLSIVINILIILALACHPIVFHRKMV